MKNTEQTSRDFYKFWGCEHVRHADIDSLGHANNAAYSTYFETGRVQALDAIRKPLNDGQYHHTAIVELQISFLKEMHQGAPIDIGVTIGKIGNSSFEIISALFIGEVCHATSTCTLVYFDTKKRKSSPLPNAIRQGFIQFQQD